MKKITGDLTALTCFQCLHNWIPRVQKPVKCPNCSSPLWNNPKKQQKRKYKRVFMLTPTLVNHERLLWQYLSQEKMTRISVVDAHRVLLKIYGYVPSLHTFRKYLSSFKVFTVKNIATGKRGRPVQHLILKMKYRNYKSDLI